MPAHADICVIFILTTVLNWSAVSKKSRKQSVKTKTYAINYSTRFLSIKLLENDREIENFISTLPNGKEIIAIRNKETLRIRKVMNEDSEQAITDAKYGFITGALKETFTDNHLEKGTNDPRDRQYCDTSHLGISYFFPCFFISCLREPLFWVTILCKVIEWLVDQFRQPDTKQYG